MCTAITYQTKDFYFGRTLDYEFTYGEAVTITPRRFPLPFRLTETMESHYAILGMAHIADGYPLYYDAFNEHGLAMAGLNFVGNAAWQAPNPDKANIAVFELIPYLLGKCESVAQARMLLQSTNITDTAFSASMPSAQLHWLLADAQEAVTIESTADGLRIYPNPAGVLTNNPPFPQQMLHLNQFMHLSPEEPMNRFSRKLDLKISLNVMV